MISHGTGHLLVPWYEAQLPTARVVTETPSDLQAHLPVLQVVSVGGSSDSSLPMRFRQIRWVLHGYALGAVAAEDFIEQAHAVTMSDLKGAALTGADVTFVGHDSGPAWTPYADTNLRQYVASYNARLLLH